MIRQVAALRNGRGCRKGTLMKAVAELPSLRLRYWDWRLCLTAWFDVSLFAGYFQAQIPFRPEPWLHQACTWSSAEQATNRPSSARTGFGGASSLVNEDSRWRCARNGMDDIRTWVPASSR